MLTAHQCEIVAYIGDGGFYCRDCAIHASSTLSIEKADEGLANGSGFDPLIRYSLDEHQGQITWENAEERVEQFRDDHPALWDALVREEWRVVDRYAEKHPVPVYCDGCWAELA